MLQLDSHTDTWDSYFGGHKLTNGTIFRRAVEENLIDPQRSVQIGLRGGLYSGDDYRDNRDLGFKTLLARELEDLGIGGALSLAHDHCVLPTYVTLDIDVLDPAFAPGTGTPEVGGMTTRELLGFLRGLTDLQTGVVAGDVVEVSPPYDPSRHHRARGCQSRLGAALPASALPPEIVVIPRVRKLKRPRIRG